MGFPTVRAWFAPRRRTGGRTRSRVPLPAVVDYPSDALEALKGVHDDLDGYVLPWGDVWIVQDQSHRGHLPRMREGQKALAMAKAQGFTPDRSEILAAAGWELLATLPYHLGTSAGYVVQYISPLMNVSQKAVDQAYKRLRAEVDGTNDAIRRTQVIQERIASSARGDWARAYRGRKVYG